MGMTRGFVQIAVVPSSELVVDTASTEDEQDTPQVKDLASQQGPLEPVLRISLKGSLS